MGSRGTRCVFILPAAISFKALLSGRSCGGGTETIRTEQVSLCVTWWVVIACIHSSNVVSEVWTIWLTREHGTASGDVCIPSGFLVDRFCKAEMVIHSYLTTQKWLVLHNLEDVEHLLAGVRALAQSPLLYPHTEYQIQGWVFLFDFWSEDSTWDSMHARQAVCQLSHILSSSVFLNVKYVSFIVMAGSYS